MGGLGGNTATGLVCNAGGGTRPQRQGTQHDGHFHQQLQQDWLVLIGQADGAGEDKFIEAGTFLVHSGKRCDEHCSSLGCFGQGWQEVGGGCHGVRANLRCLME